MATVPLQGTLRYLKGLVAAEQAQALDDRALLEDFLAERSEVAFAALVRRHGPMVLGLCRRLLRNEHDAEDVFQATFLVLACKAAALRRPESLGSWLFGVACRLARKARTCAGRRLRHERRASPRLAADPFDDLAGREAQALLDRELERLPEKYRAPVVLCGLEGLARDEAAHRLGLPLPTLKSRLEEARARLRARLGSQGLALSAALAALVAGAPASAAVPALLLRTTVQAAVAVTAEGAAAAVPATVAALAQAGLRPWLLPRLTAVAVILLALGAGGGLAVYRATATAAADAPGPVAQPVARAAPAPQPPAKEPPTVQPRELLHEALKDLQAGEDPYRNRALGDVAVLQTQLGDRAGARDTFRRAREIVNAMPEETRHMGQYELALAHARAGDAAEALATANAIPDAVQNYTGKDRGYRDQALQACATALAESGHAKAALQLVDAIADKATQAWVRPLVGAKLAQAQAHAGKIREALKTAEALQEADARVQALAGTLYLNYTFAELPNYTGVASYQARAGDLRGACRSLQRAADLARSLKDKERRAVSLATVACAWAALGELDGAREAARDIGVERWKHLALAALAERQGAAGQEKAALATLEPIHDTAAQAHGLYRLGMGLARGGHRRAAAATFQRASDLIAVLPEADRDLHRHNLATAQAIAGDAPGALQTSKLMNPGNATMTIAGIVYQQARAGDVKTALGHVKDLLQESDFWQGTALQGIARVQAERGEETAALAWARQLASPRARAHAVLGVAEGLIRRAEKAGASRGP
jgi:RNA polymerase sigma factor (sigma-70 family)